MIRTTVVLILLATNSAHAAFSPVLCSETCGVTDPSNHLQIIWYYCDDEWCGSHPTTNVHTQGDGFVQASTISGGTYQNYIDNERTLYANVYVRGIALYRNKFSTENGYDYVTVKQVSTTSLLTGVMPDNGWTTPVITNSLQLYPVKLRFVSDVSIRDSGFKFSKVRVCCDPNAVLSIPADVELGKRNTGILIGAGDVVYFAVPDAPAAHRTNLAMWGLPDANYDMKVRCNSFPTDTTWDFKATSASPLMI